jgi:hypothetical protein
LVVVATRWKHGDLFNEWVGPRGISIDIPITCLPLRCSREHARYLSALWVNLNYTRDIDFKTLNHRRAIRFVLNQHSIDWPMHVPLSPNFGFGCRSIQVLIYNVQKKSFATLYTDDADCDEV